jgi:hypothetical protein
LGKTGGFLWGQSASGLQSRRKSGFPDGGYHVRFVGSHSLFVYIGQVQVNKRTVLPRWFVQKYWAGRTKWGVFMSPPLNHYVHYPSSIRCIVGTGFLRPGDMRSLSPAVRACQV